MTMLQSNHGAVICPVNCTLSFRKRRRAVSLRISRLDSDCQKPKDRCVNCKRKVTGRMNPKRVRNTRKLVSD